MKVFAENRKARNSYEFSEYIEAGIVLTGAETKSIRNGAVSIVDAFAIIENEEAIIREMNIEHYKYSNELDYNAKSPRKLLLHKKEIKRLIGLTSIKGSHVLAAAISGSADLIVTLNKKDFPRHILGEEGVDRRDPDALLYAAFTAFTIWVCC